VESSTHSLEPRIALAQKEIALAQKEIALARKEIALAQTKLGEEKVQFDSSMNSAGKLSLIFSDRTPLGNCTQSHLESMVIVSRRMFSDFSRFQSPI
jgi:hypothetical protein